MSFHEDTKISSRDGILRILADSLGEPVPGRELARLTGISRAGVWKQVASLRKAGVGIRAERKKGYLLESVPDRLFPVLLQKDLATNIVGKRIEYRGVTGSTNSDARNLAVRGVPDGTVVVAEHQTKGRGRLDRTWIARPNENILMSVIFYPKIGTSLAFRLTMMASVAIVRAVKKACGVALKIKWPNDLYAGDRKVCGILTEFSADHDMIHYIVVGIGLNVNFNTARHSEIRAASTSLMEICGHELSRVLLLKVILAELDGLYQSFSETRGEGLDAVWNAHSLVMDRRVRILSGAEEKIGIARGITPDGHLVISNENGEREEIVCGDLSLRMD